jgi:hypothetical protein
MKSRRRIAFPRRNNHVSMTGDQIRNLRPAKWGPMACLRSNNLARRMSLEGQTERLGGLERQQA